jgi:hypothetical protein
MADAAGVENELSWLGYHEWGGSKRLDMVEIIIMMLCHLETPTVSS